MQSLNNKFGLFVAGAIVALMLMAVRSHGEGNDYKLGSDDSIATTVFDHPELSVALRVSKSGNITFPLLGVVPVSGLSTREVEELLVRKLSDGGFVRQPQVSVTVTDYQSQKVAVMGLVTRPGQYALTTSNKVLDLLAQAGGLVNGATAGAANGVAGDDAILVHRDGTKVKLDLNAMFEGDSSQNPPVSGGDTVFVPRAPVFYIYGQVQRSGSYKLERSMTVDQAISAGGGLTLKGSEHRIIVKRRDAKGKTRDVSVKGRDLVQPDDVINVREGWF